MSDGPTPPVTSSETLSPLINVQAALRAMGVGSVPLRALEPPSRFDEARWPTEACGFRL